MGDLSVVLCFLWRRLGDWFDGLANVVIAFHRGWVRFVLRGQILSGVDRANDWLRQLFLLPCQQSQQPDDFAGAN